MHEKEPAAVSGQGPYRRVEVKRVVNASIERVWDAITDIDKVRQWWADGEIDAREQGRIRLSMDTDDCDGLGLDGIIKVFQPPHIFEFTWHEKYDPAMGLVRFDLVELGPDSTEVTLVNMVPAVDVIAAASGWHEIMDSMRNYINHGEPIVVPENDTRFKELQSFYEDLLAAGSGQT